MKTLRLMSGTFVLVIMLGLSKPASATANSFDGTSITPTPTGQSLFTAAGKWTFSTQTGSGGNVVLLNGSQAAGMTGVKMYVGNGTNLYVKDNETPSPHWYEWNNGTWIHLFATSPFQPSADGASMMPGASPDLVTPDGGIWAFSTATGNGGNVILLNGSPASNGRGELLLIDRSGQLYSRNNSESWFVWSGSAWTSTTDPQGTFSVQCASAVVVTLNWAAVSGATSYTVTRGSTTVGTTALLTITDQGVAPSTTYSYTLKASTGSTQPLTVITQAATPSGDAAYCPSTVIEPITVNWSSGINQQNSSDTWNQSEGGDGNEYGIWGDGCGFGFSGTCQGSGFKDSWGVGEIESGSGSLATTVNVYGGINTEHSPSISGKANAFLEIGTPPNMNFYAIGSEFKPTCTTQGGSGCYGPTNNPNDYLIYSIGNAWTWTDNSSNWVYSNGTAGNFFPLGFLQNGAGYQGNTDGYVYIYGAGPTSGATYLWRVSSAQGTSPSILNSSDYQAFSGYNLDGTPIWTTSTSFATLNSKMAPVFLDRGPSPDPIEPVTFDSHLGRYIGSAGGNNANQQAFYDAPNPWGPWTSIGYFNPNPDNSGGWGNLGQGITSGWGSSVGQGLGVFFIPKWSSWTSPTETMWVVFSSNGNASGQALLPTLQGKSMNSFSAVSFNATLAP